MLKMYLLNPLEVFKEMGRDIINFIGLTFPIKERY